MARPEQRLAANVEGPFYVDSSCIDCGTCWQYDPLHYAPSGSHSRVQRQPEGDVEQRQALLALQACPVAAIGTSRELLLQTPADGFPELITRAGPAPLLRSAGFIRTMLMRRPKPNST